MSICYISLFCAICSYLLIKLNGKLYRDFPPAIWMQNMILISGFQPQHIVSLSLQVGYTPLHCAAVKGHIAVLLLLSKGADVNKAINVSNYSDVQLQHIVSLYCLLWDSVLQLMSTKLAVYLALSNDSIMEYQCCTSNIPAE